MKNCSNGHPEISFTDDLTNCPVCVMWDQFGGLTKQVGDLQKQIEKRHRIDEAVKIIYSTLEK